MSYPIVSQPTTAITTLPPITASLATEDAAYQRGLAWLNARVGSAIPRGMQWSECPLREWPDTDARPLRFWLLTAHTKRAMYAVIVALYPNGTMTVNGEVAEARD